MKVGIVGAGALGSLLAFALCEQAEVWMLTHWQEQIDTIRAAGLRCEQQGRTSTRYPKITSDPSQIGPCDVVLIAVKSYQTASAAEHLASLLRTNGPPTLVITLQNGIGNREMLAERVGQPIGQGVTALGATMLAAGHVRHAGTGATTFAAQPDPEAVAALAALFNQCGLPASVSSELDGIVWGKLIANVGINALSALLRVPNGALAQHETTRLLMGAAVAEAVAVAAALDIELPYADPLAHVLAIANATSANRSSMLQDVLRGSPSEIAAINGAIVREGQRVGVATPVNRMLTELILALEATSAQRIA